MEPPKDDKPTPIDVSQQFIKEIELIDEAKAKTVEFNERDFPERKFPIRYNKGTKRWEWEEEEVRRFYEDPDNVSRTIYCPRVNNDETDDWGMFGYGPGFTFIEKATYKGERSFADQAALLGLSIVVDPKTGLGVMPHNDYFPKNKFERQLIRRYDRPALFGLLCDIFTKRAITSHSQIGQLPPPNKTV